MYVNFDLYLFAYVEFFFWKRHIGPPTAHILFIDIFVFLLTV